MSTTHVWIVLGCIAGGTLLAPVAVRGQVSNEASKEASELYGDGVHAYFRGNSTQADISLSSAMAMNSEDPRTYYFRALSLLRLGRADEARGDMSVGAALEARQPNRFAIGKSLERVQGHDRLLLEQFRRQARLEAAANGPVDAASHSMADPPGGEAETLRQRVVVPLDEFARPGDPTLAPARTTAPPVPPRTFAEPPAADRVAPVTNDDPFRDDPQPAAASPRPVPPAAKDSDQPAAPTESGVEPSGAATGDAVTPAAQPQSEEVAPEEVPVNDDDPFGIF